MKKITENTLIPLSFLAVIVGVIFFISTIYNTSNQAMAEATRCNVDVQVMQTNMMPYMRDIESRLGRIEGFMETLIEVKKQKSVTH